MTLREAAHKLIEHLSETQLGGLLELFGDDYFSPEEVEEIRGLRENQEWTDWRSLRPDV